MKKFLITILLIILILSVGFFVWEYVKENYLDDQVAEVKETIEDELAEKRKTPGQDRATPRSSERITVYFSKVYEGDPKAAVANPENIDKQLVKKLLAAEKSIDAALHELDSYIIADALVRARENGVTVRVVTETDYMEEESIETLIEAGIPVVNDDGRSGLMHNKFIVVDSQYVWTGSFNTTFNGANKNNNNAVYIHSPKLAENFMMEFNEMFTGKEFGGRSDESIKHEVIQFGDSTELISLFSPENDVDEYIISEIAKADTQIRFMAFSFTHDGIGDAMIAKTENGVDVKGVFEARGTGTQYSEYGKMKDAGLDVRLDANKYICHHKVIVIDDDTTILGSFNFSQNATETNDENLLIIRNNKRIATKFLEEFDRLFSAAEPTS